jgi:MFS family permease
LLQFAYVWSFSNMESTLALLLDERFHWNPGSVGGLFAFAGVVMVVLQGGLVGRLTNLFGERALLLAGFPLTGLGMLALPFVPTAGGVYAAMACLAAGSGLVTPALSSLLSRRVAAQLQGATLGLGASMSSLGRIFGPFWGGLAFDRWHYPAPYLSGAAVLLGSVIFALVAVTSPLSGAPPTISVAEDEAAPPRSRSA